MTPVATPAVAVEVLLPAPRTRTASVNVVVDVPQNSVPLLQLAVGNVTTTVAVQPIDKE